MASWSAEQLADFFIAKGLRGLADALRSWGVTGADLLVWAEASDIERDLKWTPFAARKAVTVRDEFLAL